MKKFRCLVVDDEPLAIDIIERYLQHLSNIEITRCESAVAAFRVLQELQFDVIFLDIEMPLLNGLDFLKSVQQPPAVVIVSAFKDYALEGFEQGVTDYLVKPVSFPRFMKAFERAVKASGQVLGSEENARVADNEYLFLKTDRKFIKILTDDILYIESLKDYVRVTTAAGSWLSYQTLTVITEKLPAEKFMRIHRSFTIAINKVSAVEGSYVDICGKQIPISRELKQDVLEKICK